MFLRNVHKNFLVISGGEKIKEKNGIKKKVVGETGVIGSSSESEHCDCKFVTGSGPLRVILPASRLRNFRKTSLSSQQVSSNQSSL